MSNMTDKLSEHFLPDGKRNGQPNKYLYFFYPFFFQAKSIKNSSH